MLPDYFIYYHDQRRKRPSFSSGRGFSRPSRSIGPTERNHYQRPLESSIVTGSVGMHKVAISRNDVSRWEYTIMRNLSSLSLSLSLFFSRLEVAWHQAGQVVAFASVPRTRALRSARSKRTPRFREIVRTSSEWSPEGPVSVAVVLDARSFPGLGIFHRGPRPRPKRSRVPVFAMI